MTPGGMNNGRLRSGAERRPTAGSTKQVPQAMGPIRLAIADPGMPH
jgi:hypothetical protein